LTALPSSFCSQMTTTAGRSSCTRPSTMPFRGAPTSICCSWRSPARMRHALLLWLASAGGSCGCTMDPQIPA
jgi:hypothetical protein